MVAGSFCSRPRYIAHHTAHPAICCCAQAYEELGGTWKTRAGGAPADVDEGGDAADAPPTDIAAALASEVAELKEPAKQPFRWVHVWCRAGPVLLAVGQCLPTKSGLAWY